MRNTPTRLDFRVGLGIEPRFLRLLEWGITDRFGFSLGHRQLPGFSYYHNPGRIAAMMSGLSASMVPLADL
jgi:hypothetical protein